MWNQFRTDDYDGMFAETIALKGYNGDIINAYFSRPLGPGPFPGIVLVHHIPGWDELYREMARRLTQHGYGVICPNLYHRFGHSTPDNVAAKARSQGGISDDYALGDCAAAMAYFNSQPYSNGKVGIMGSCSGGRHAVLAASRIKGFNAAVDCWGGRVVMSKEELSRQQPVAPIDYTKDLSCPLLGIFGAEDHNPTPEQVQEHEHQLKRYKKPHEFHMYPEAGHGFFYYDRPYYRQEQAMDGWQKIFAFFGKYLH